ncbi:MAG TPA: DinB family protein, partial [Thermoanaerobaculia bacterium]|nr:DinB family protein [Thermoanaerobaculia bacterium]
RTKLWQRILLRFTLVPKILRGGAFPKSARAPRETRPQMPEHGQAEAIARFQERAARFNDAASDPRHTRARLTHAYFGRSSVTESMVLCARHIEHHRAQLEG